MENPMLKATAAPFQPGKPATPRQTSNGLQAGTVNGANGQRHGAPGGFLPPHVLSQIQNQIGSGSPRQGGLTAVPMNAQSRPFVPGMPQAHQQQHVQPQHMPVPFGGLPPAQQHGQAFQSAATSPVLSRPIPPRLGHGMNPGSVQLTGLQTFLGGPSGLPLSISPGSQSHMMGGPASPMTPGLPPSSPFMFPSGQTAMGPARGGKHRKGRGPAPITPLKTTGHNSTPSISLNPAAFAASLAAAKAKKKVVVAIPKEGPQPNDDALLAQTGEDDQTVPEDAEDADADVAEERRIAKVKLRAARDAAAIRSKWILREPLSEVDLTWRDQMPADAMISCEIHPEPWPSHVGLPDTIDIYLPGQSAWDEYQEIRMEEKLAEAEAEAQALASARPQAPEVHGDTAIDNAWKSQAVRDVELRLSTANRSQSMSIPSPSDATLANFRLNRYLASQDTAEGDPNLPAADSAQRDEGAGRFQDALPLKLREAFAKRQKEGTEAKARSSSGHGYTMSLGMPSSGGPFGPAALSALDMVRASSDAGPSEPAMGDRPVLPKERSEPDLTHLRSSEPSLAGIDEASEESEGEEGRGAPASAAARPAGWKELARGFGYDLDNEEADATPRLPSSAEIRRHSRQASRISVSTSRQGGVGDEQDGDDELDELDEVRTNPSEDADASDFEEEIDSDAEVGGDQHWSRRTNGRKLDLGSGQKRYGGGYCDDLSDMSDDNLRDSLTPSDEQFSNPSDEEAAREERLLRRQHRATLREARHETRRRRARSGTNNTLPSSSIGEADALEHTAGKPSGWTFPASKTADAHAEHDIISNPSDELQSDFDERGTFGGPLDQGHVSGDRLSQDFRFPPPQHAERRASQHGIDAGASPFQFIPPQAGTLGRASGTSFLNPGAKEFSFGRQRSGETRDVQDVADHEADTAGRPGHNPHFRLPSINNSSFGSSTFGDVVTRQQPGPNAGSRPSLNAAAPSFTPGSFTFTAPGGAPRLEMPASEPVGVAVTVEDVDGDDRGAQGREKRQKFGPLDNVLEEDEYLRPASPPRLKGSTATIEGPLRDFGTLSRRGPPPFDAAGLLGQRTASVSRFKPDAPVFTPSWGRSTSYNGTSGRRPGLPDFGFGALGEAPEASSQPKFFAFGASENKAIPIRNPGDGWTAAESDTAAQQQRPSGLSATKQDSEDQAKEIRAPLPHELVDGPDVGPDHTINGGADPEKTPMASAWDRAKGANQISLEQYGRSPPISVPRPPPIYDHRGVPIPVSTDAHPMSKKHRVFHKHSLSRDSAAMSEDSRPRRGAAYTHAHAQPNSFDTDDESLTDFIEELAERMDKALEGWAGKILDEVTIMGQVRPIHKPGTDAIDKDEMIDSFARRVENLMDSYVSKVSSVAATRNSTDSAIGDDSQATVKGVEGVRAHQALGALDAAGELDFDYVQEILDVKMRHLQEELKRSFNEMLSARETENKRDEKDEDPATQAASSGLMLSEETFSQLASLLSTKLSTAFGDHAQQQTSDLKDQLSSILEPALEEHTAHMQNKAAADRLETAHLVVDKIKGNLQGLDDAIVDLRSSFSDQVQVAMMKGLIPHLEMLRTEPVDGDVIAARVTEILAPMISDERERRREEKRASEELTRSPSFSAEAVAEETLHKLVPIVSSLKSDPIDSDALVERLSEVIGKQSIEHLVDLSPVIALLEPIIAKQEDIRSFTKRMIDRQEEVERTMSELPGAINAKTEIFLSAAGQTQDASTTILSRIDALNELLRAKSETRDDAASGQDETFVEMLKASREEAKRAMEEAETARSELSVSQHQLTDLQVALARLEGKLGETEKELSAAQESAEAAKAKEAKSTDKANTVEQKLLQSESGVRELQLGKEAAVKEAAMYKAHMDQLATELNEAREERAREREAAAQATAEALARAERAERQAVEAEKRANERAEASTAAERQAHDEAKAAIERAAKAEGQVTSLEKRAADQDSKLANLQALSAAQKQKTAMNQQKLSEAEKKVKDFDLQARDLAVAAARLEELENRVKDDEDLRERLREAQDGEARLRGEVAQYHARFSELEKDLITMKESLVGRDELEACQNDLSQSREEVARLKGQLAERERLKPDGWVEVTSASTADRTKSGSWSSMHAPSQATPRLASDQKWSRYGLGQDTGAATSADTSADLSQASDGYADVRRPSAMRSVSIASTTTREVEQDDGGWWS